MAAAIEKGAEIIKAKNEVRSVPIKKGSIPKCSLTGSHVFPHKKPKPLALIAGQDEIVKVRKNEFRISLPLWISKIPDNKSLINNANEILEEMSQK